jgi:hypothetical protein
MHQTATDPCLSGEARLEDEARHPVESSSRLAPLSESRGVVRDALAAVGNLEHLLRSPKVGPRALAQVIPGLRGLCEPLLASMHQMIGHIRASAELPVDTACDQLATFAEAVCARLGAALSSERALDARGRLAFESSLVRAGEELNSVRLLLDLLIRATERSDTELHIDELVRVLFGPNGKPAARANAVRVVASYTGEATGFEADPQLLIPLVSVGIAMVYGAQAASDDPIYFTAASQEDTVTVGVTNDQPVPGEVHLFDTPLIVPPTLECVRSAASLLSGTFEADLGRVLISWPRGH